MRSKIALATALALCLVAPASAMAETAYSFKGDGVTAAVASSLAMFDVSSVEIGASRDSGQGGKVSLAGKKKGCPKGKGKKKGACPEPPTPAGCAPFQPGEKGQGQPTVMLTDAATESAPAEHKVTLAQSTADVRGEASYAYFNVQVDPASADAGLYVLFEFPTRRDYDLSLFHTDGSYAARSRAFNPVYPDPSGRLSTTGHGGEATDRSEKLVGIRTADCGGWTVAAENHLGEGGDFTLKLWLGEAKTDPQEPGKEKPRS